MSADEFGSKFFANDSTPSGVLEYSGTLEEDKAKQLVKSWDEVHKGSGKAFKTALLEGGLKFTPLTLNQKDSQFIETRAFQVADVARIFRVPTIMIGGAGDADKSNTYASAEQQMLSFVQNTIRPWLVRWEASIRLNLLTESERKRFFAEFKLESLLRGDIKTRYEAYRIGREWGWLSADDVRRLENLDPLDVEGADEYVRPMNVTALGSEPEPEPEPIQEELPIEDEPMEDENGE
jgi:HK97 family phage portal protein